MRLIDADLIMDCLLNEGQNNGEKYGIKWGRKIIFTPYEVAKIVARTVPTVDAVPVVRCKDCKHFAEELCWNIYGRCTPVSDMDYCSCGEKRDNDDTISSERKEDSEE